MVLVEFLLLILNLVKYYLKSSNIFIYINNKMNTKIFLIILLLIALIISTLVKKSLEGFDNHPSPSPDDNPSPSPEFNSNDNPSSIDLESNNSKENNSEKTIFFINNLPNKKFIEKVINKIKDITKKSVTNEIKNNEIVYKIDMKMEELTEEMRENIILQIRYEILNRLNNELNLSYKPEQISITFSSGSVIITVKILSLDEIDKKRNSEKSPEGPRNYIQIRPQGKTGLYVPTTIIGGVEQEFDGSSSSLGGMSLT